MEPCACNPPSQYNVLLSHYIVMLPPNTFPAPSFIYNKITNYKLKVLSPLLYQTELYRRYRVCISLLSSHSCDSCQYTLQQTESQACSDVDDHFGVVLILFVSYQLRNSLMVAVSFFTTPSVS